LKDTDLTGTSRPAGRELVSRASRPGQARFTIKLGITINTRVILTAGYFHYVVGRG
jgi:hypothetical protein